MDNWIAIFLCLPFLLPAFIVLGAIVAGSIRKSESVQKLAAMVRGLFFRRNPFRKSGCPRCYRFST